MVNRNMPTMNIPTKNIVTGKLPMKKNSKTLAPREPPGRDLRISTRAKRITDRNNVATYKNKAFFCGDLSSWDIS